MSSSRADRVVELDALRGVAVLMVLLYHYTTRFSELFPQASPTFFAFPNGHYGVELFFVISGFVITMTLHRSKCASDFVIARFSRLFPAYWSAVLLTSTVLWLAAGPLEVPAGRQVAVNLTMIHSLFKVPSVDGVYWTLEVELLFYAMALALFTTGLLRRLEVPLFAWLILAALFASPLWEYYFPAKPLAGIVARVLILQHAPFFAIGVLFHRIYRGEGTAAWNYGLIAFALAILILSGPLPVALLVAAACAVLWKLALGGLGFLRVRPLVFFGTISYSLYLVHQKIGHTVMAKVVDHGFSTSLGFVLATVLSVGLATALTFLIEKPALAAIRNWYKRSNWRAKRHAIANARALGRREGVTGIGL